MHPQPRTTFVLRALLLGAFCAHAALAADLRFDDGSIGSAARAVRKGGGLRVRSVALAPGEAPADLALERFSAFAPDAVITVHGAKGDSTLPVPDNAYFRGGVVGHPESTAVLTALASGEVRGLVFDRGRAYAIGHDHKAGGKLATRAVDAAKEGSGRSFECGVDGMQPVPQSLRGPEPADATSAADPVTNAFSFTARVAVETDFELY